MQLDGIHHITCITADARGTVDFYARVLGLRLVKKTVNFDAPDVYHLYYGDERGSPGSILTFFEFLGVPRARGGARMIDPLAWRVAGPAALDFWERRLAGEGVTPSHRDERLLVFSDPEGLELALLADDFTDPPPAAPAPAAARPPRPPPARRGAAHPARARPARLRRRPRLRERPRARRAAVRGR